MGISREATDPRRAHATRRPHIGRRSRDAPGGGPFHARKLTRPPRAHTPTGTCVLAVHKYCIVAAGAAGLSHTHCRAPTHRSPHSPTFCGSVDIAQAALAPMRHVVDQNTPHRVCCGH